MFRRSPAFWRGSLTGAAARRWLAARPLVAHYLKRLGPSARILDVGCGVGALVHDLREIGFARAEGVDPFVARDIFHQGRRLVRKAHLHETTGSYDCLSMHHALEHMPDQHAVFHEARRLVAPGGMLLLRIPVADGFAWREYREDWVQLDPPRHFYLHSRRSLELVAARAGFRLESVECDSDGFQFWGSERYRRDMPLIPNPADQNP